MPTRIFIPHTIRTLLLSYNPTGDDISIRILDVKSFNVRLVTFLLRSITIARRGHLHPHPKLQPFRASISR